MPARSARDFEKNETLATALVNVAHSDAPSMLRVSFFEMEDGGRSLHRTIHYRLSTRGFNSIAEDQARQDPGDGSVIALFINGSFGLTNHFISATPLALYTDAKE